MPKRRCLLVTCYGAVLRSHSNSEFVVSSHQIDGTSHEVLERHQRSNNVDVSWRWTSTSLVFKPHKHSEKEHIRCHNASFTCYLLSIKFGYHVMSITWGLTYITCTITPTFVTSGHRVFCCWACEPDLKITSASNQIPCKSLSHFFHICITSKHITPGTEVTWTV